MDYIAEGSLTHAESLHNHTLTAECTVTVKLNAHNPIAEFTVRRRCLKEGELLRTGLSKGNGVDSLCRGALEGCWR